jgi:hypothetical protein
MKTHDTNTLEIHLTTAVKAHCMYDDVNTASSVFHKHARNIVITDSAFRQLKTASRVRGTRHIFSHSTGTTAAHANV